MRFRVNEHATFMTLYPCRAFAAVVSTDALIQIGSYADVQCVSKMCEGCTQNTRHNRNRYVHHRRKPSDWLRFAQEGSTALVFYRSVEITQIAARSVVMSE